MIINKAKPVLASVDHNIDAHLIDYAWYSGGILEDFLYCLICEYFTFGSCSFKLMTYVGSGSGLIIIIQPALDINTLAYCRAFLKLLWSSFFVTFVAKKFIGLLLG